MKVYWAFDVISPFAYLSFKQLPRVPSEHELVPVPVLFAGLLNHYGHVGPAEIAPKRLFTYRFALWRAQKMGIAMRLPPAHPFNPLMALRLIVAAGSSFEAIKKVFDATWRDGLDVTQRSVIDTLAEELGIQDVEATLGQPSVKQALHDNTTWAISQQLFGVPSFVIDEQIFWGHDSFEMALEFLDDPHTFSSSQMKRIESLPVGVSRKSRAPSQAS